MSSLAASSSTQACVSPSPTRTSVAPRTAAPAAMATDTHRMRPTSHMPGFQLGAQEAADIATYAAENWLPDSGEAPWQTENHPVQPALAPQGQRLFTNLGCAGCHRVAGIRLHRCQTGTPAPSDRVIRRCGPVRTTQLDVPTLFFLPAAKSRGLHLPNPACAGLIFTAGEVSLAQARLCNCCSRLQPPGVLVALPPIRFMSADHQQACVMSKLNVTGIGSAGAPVSG